LNSTAQRQASLLMVTHDHELLGHFDRVVDLMQFHA
jgi:ABC-type lipoprotein export system ATPase subunit